MSQQKESKKARGARAAADAAKRSAAALRKELDDLRAEQARDRAAVLSALRGIVRRDFPTAHTVRVVIEIGGIEPVEIPVDMPP